MRRWEMVIEPLPYAYAAAKFLLKNPQRVKKWGRFPPPLYLFDKCRKITLAPLGYSQRRYRFIEVCIFHLVFSCTYVCQELHYFIGQELNIV